MKYPYLLSILTLFATPAFAGVGKVSSPEVAKGVAEVEYSGTRYSDGSAALNNKQSHTYEFEYGFTDRFMLGVEVASKRASPKGHELSGYGLEAQYALTQQSEWWLSSAIKGEYLHAAHDGSPDNVEMKLLAARDFGANRIVGNLNIEQEFGDNHDHGVALSSAFQAKHKINSHFAPGIEWHAEYGKLSNLGESDTREHYVGPMVSGDLFEIGGHDLEYTAGYYWGLTDDSANHAARIQLSYDFAF